MQALLEADLLADALEEVDTDLPTGLGVPLFKSCRNTAPSIDHSCTKLRKGYLRDCIKVGETNVSFLPLVQRLEYGLAMVDLLILGQPRTLKSRTELLDVYLPTLLRIDCQVPRAGDAEEPRTQL